MNIRSHAAIGDWPEVHTLVRNAFEDAAELEARGGNSSGGAVPEDDGSANEPASWLLDDFADYDEEDDDESDGFALIEEKVKLVEEKETLSPSKVKSAMVAMASLVSFAPVQDIALRAAAEMVNDETLVLALQAHAALEEDAKHPKWQPHRNGLGDVKRNVANQSTGPVLTLAARCTHDVLTQMALVSDVKWGRIFALRSIVRELHPNLWATVCETGTGGGVGEHPSLSAAEAAVVEAMEAVRADEGVDAKSTRECFNVLSASPQFEGLAFSTAKKLLGKKTTKQKHKQKQKSQA